ncbi:MAG: DUF503 domain-containing protein [Desulfurella sp.]|uniref:DUF503 domain-containing protein n=1 Tax=Desulfurella multipotens TaxID=79269 RepID=A0A1G6LR62_9BACT|nr:MAG: DUF503 domain-containing protein [Desulfurella multipotens]PMP92919.1 MAG: DUF503 domain-containing protein [Desulfurella sp.]SDC45681.1 hypothetical protein SAMN05660835_00879 [Desulfurella multipotens]
MCGILFIGILIVELLLKDAFNIKDRRNIISSIINKLRANYNVSVADVSEKILYNKATLAIATVSNKKSATEKFMDNIYNFILNNYLIEILHIERQIL